MDLVVSNTDILSINLFYVYFFSFSAFYTYCKDLVNWAIKIDFDDS